MRALHSKKMPSDNGSDLLRIEPQIGTRLPRPISMRAFTLVEMIVVIALIAVLAALAIPTINFIREKSNQSNCTNQLRTFGRIFSNYAADNDMKIAWVDWASTSFNPKASRSNPYADYWGSSGQETLLKHRECPANQFPKAGTPSYHFAQLGFNNKILKTSTPTFKLNAAAEPSQLLLMMDVVPGEQIRFDRKDYCWETAVKPLCVNTSNPKQIRHSGGVNALFADFHVEHVKWSRLDPSTEEGQKNRSKWLTIQ